MALHIAGSTAAGSEKQRSDYFKTRTSAAGTAASQADDCALGLHQMHPVRISLAYCTQDLHNTQWVGVSFHCSLCRFERSVIFHKSPCTGSLFSQRLYPGDVPKHTLFPATRTTHRNAQIENPNTIHLKITAGAGRRSLFNSGLFIVTRSNRSVHFELLLEAAVLRRSALGGAKSAESNHLRRR